MYRADAVTVGHPDTHAPVEPWLSRCLQNNKISNFAIKYDFMR